MIEIIRSGLLTTVQDAGRYGGQRMGISPCGAMDRFSLAIANLLVRNPIGCEALEFTLLGPDVRFLLPNAFAAFGGKFSPALNGRPIEMGRAYLAQTGDLLTLGPAMAGARGYLAVAGGFDLKSYLGSKSTCLTGGFGGHEGRALRQGDRLNFANPVADLPNLPGRVWKISGTPSFSAAVLRVIPGPQEHLFSQQGVNAFYSGNYCVTSDSNRMGYRLDGPPVEQAPGSNGNVISDGIAFGSIQIPQNQPIILMADRQTTGGYAKIATVISADLPRLAQLKPGDYMRFSAVTVEEAQQALIEQHEMLVRFAEQIDNPSPPFARIFRITVNSVSYEVVVEPNNRERIY